MNHLELFRAELPAWRVATEAWLDTLPAGVRTSPSRASCLYLLSADPLAALAPSNLLRQDPWHVDWATLEGRAREAGVIETFLVEAARRLAHDDPGPALALLLLHSDVEPFTWAHSAGTLYELVRERLSRHAFST